MVRHASAVKERETVEVLLDVFLKGPQVIAREYLRRGTLNSRQA